MDILPRAMTYSHRNGETEPPTVRGCYIYQGKIIKPGQVRGSYHRTCGLVIGASDDLRFRIGNLGFGRGGEAVCVRDCSGQWWGPITLPWEKAE